MSCPRRSSRSAVAARLTEIGVPTPAHKRGDEQARFSARGNWHGTAVGWIVRNPTYKGEWLFGKTRQTTIDGKHRKQRKPREQAIAVSIPPTLTVELWQLANDAIDQAKARSTRNAKYDYLLRGLSTCTCERTVIGNCRTRHRCDGSVKVYRWYICPSGRTTSARYRECSTRSWVNADQLETLVWDSVVRVLTSRGVLETMLQEEAERRRVQRNQIEERLAAATSAQADIEARLKRFLDLDLSGYPAAVVDRARKELIEQYQKLSVTRTQLEAELADLPAIEDLLPTLETLREDVLLGTAEATPGEKRRVLELLRVRLTVEHDGSLILKLIASDYTRLKTSSRGSVMSSIA